MFIGADIDSYTEGTSIGIQKKNIANYQKEEKGIKTLFKTLSNTTRKFYDEGIIEEDWKKDLEQEKRL